MLGKASGIKKPSFDGFLKMAVGQGFEPREPLGSTGFKTAAFDHSASPPKLFVGKAPDEERALYRRAPFDQVAPLPVRRPVDPLDRCWRAGRFAQRS